MKKWHLSLAALLVILGVSSSSRRALAAITVFTDRAAFETAVGGTVVTETFEASPLGALAVGTTDLGLVSMTIDGNSEGTNEIRDFGNVNGSREFHGDIDTGAATFIDVTFDLPLVRGFGGDFASTTTGDLLTVTVAGTTIEFDNFLSGDGDGFLGVTSDVPFANITFRSEDLTSFGEAFQLDNLSFAPPAAAVPEPSTLLMGGMVALLGLGYARRRGKSAA